MTYLYKYKMMSYMRKILCANLFVLTVLQIANCQDGYFHSLQEAMQQPDSVISLTLKKNKLKEFPIEILQMKNIERLDLSRNSIKEIPKEIGNLKNLHYVNVAQNYLSALPKEMSKLPLDTLILWDNQIREFDENFKNNNLKFLDIRAISMTRKEQKAIKQLFPKTKIKKDHPCNCN